MAHYSKDKKILINADGKGTFIIPDCVIKIGDSAFAGLDEISEIIIPDSVIEIGSYAFCHCYGLTSVRIPDSVEELGQYAFQGCRNLQKVELSNKLKIIPQFCFHACFSLYSITIPINVEIIEACAFQYTHIFPKGLLFLPDSVKKIEQDAFANTDFSLISLPKQIEKIGREAFYKSELSSITFRKSTTNCLSNKYSIIIPDSAELGEDAFEECRNIESIWLPNSFVRINLHTFNYCTALKYIHIGVSTNKIFDSSFDTCKQLEEIEVDDDNLYFKTMNGILYSKDLNCLIKVPHNLMLDEYIIPENVECVKNFPINNVYIKRIFFPSNLKKIMLHSYMGDVVKEIHLPVVDPNAINIEYDHHLMDISMLNHINIELYVPYGTKSLYENHPFFSIFFKITEEKSI